MKTLGEMALKALDTIRGRKRDIGITFGTPAGQRTLAIIAKYCRANESCFHPDERTTIALEGRREVYLYLTKHLNYTPEQLLEIFNGGTVTTGETE